jgi:hypothetical protein
MTRKKLPSISVSDFIENKPPLTIIGDKTIIKTPINDKRIPVMTFLRGLSFKKRMEKIYKKIGCDEAIIGALILSVFCIPRKKKLILMLMPKKAPSNNINQSLPDILCQCFIPHGKNKTAAPKKRINAKVNGGMLIRAYLNIGEAAPQITLVIIKAKTGFIR